MVSSKLMRQYTVHKADKYKNYRTSNEEKYADVRPLSEYMINKGKYTVVIVDPPYSIQQGGHTALNCDLKQSAAAIKFNDQYGTTLRYSASMILGLIVETMESAMELLTPGGFLLLKCKDYKGAPYTTGAVCIAQKLELLDFWGTYLFSTRDKVVRNPNDISTMLVFKKKTTEKKRHSTSTEFGQETLLMSTEQLRGLANVDYQSITIEARKREFKLQEDYAELLVCFAAMASSFEEFKVQVKRSFDFDSTELETFLTKHNITTDIKFKRITSNSQVLRRKRKEQHEGRQQKQLKLNISSKGT